MREIRLMEGEKDKNRQLGIVLAASYRALLKMLNVHSSLTRDDVNAIYQISFMAGAYRLFSVIPHCRAVVAKGFRCVFRFDKSMHQLRQCTIRCPIRPRLLIYAQIRCIRTKPVRLLPPKQSSILPSWNDVQRDFRKRIRRKPEDQRIPMVPKFTEDEKAIIQPKVKNDL